MDRETYMGNTLDLKINEHGKKNTGNSNKESIFLDKIIDKLDFYCKCAKLPKVIKYATQFRLEIGRIDLIVQHENNKYSIWEAKYENERKAGEIELYFVKGIAQLLSYRTVLVLTESIDIRNIDLILVVNKDCTWIPSILNLNKIDCTLLCIAENEIKGYKYWGIKSNE